MVHMLHDIAECTVNVHSGPRYVSKNSLLLYRNTGETSGPRAQSSLQKHLVTAVRVRRTFKRLETLIFRENRDESVIKEWMFGLRRWKRNIERTYLAG